MSIYSVAVFAHIIGGTILVMSLVIMQLVVGPAASKITDVESKKNVMAAIQGRWHPVVDVAIVVQSVTAIFFMVTQWEWIAGSTILHVKVTTGIITLSIANALHFYFRGKKQRLKAAGDMDKLLRANKLTQVMEKIALVAGAITFLLALFLNHSPL